MEHEKEAEKIVEPLRESVDDFIAEGLNPGEINH